MHPLALAVGYAWLVFWIYWLVSASTSKESVRGGWRTRLTGVSAVGVFVIAVVLRGGGLAVHSVILATIGAVLFACGIALAVWGPPAPRPQLGDADDSAGRTGACHLGPPTGSSVTRSTPGS